MATKKKPVPKAKPKAKPAPQKTPAAKKSVAPPSRSVDDSLLLDEPLVDASGAFRVTSVLAAGQRGHDEDASRTFADSSLVMAAQTDNFREEGSTLGDAADENMIEDETVRAERRQRLITLAARAQQPRRPR